MFSLFYQFNEWKIRLWDRRSQVCKQMRSRFSREDWLNLIYKVFTAWLKEKRRNRTKNWKHIPFSGCTIIFCESAEDLSEQTEKTYLSILIVVITDFNQKFDWFVLYGTCKVVLLVSVTVTITRDKKCLLSFTEKITLMSSPPRYKLTARRQFLRSLHKGSVNTWTENKSSWQSCISLYVQRPGK